MQELCGLDCCSKCCLRGTACPGCAETQGHPCGGSCTAAECIHAGGTEAMLAQKKALIEEINALGIPGLQVSELYLLIGSYVNLEYPLPGGQTAKLLRDDRTYWGNQVEYPGQSRCYGIVADDRWLLVCEYGENGADPEILLLRNRK